MSIRSLSLRPVPRSMIIEHLQRSVAVNREGMRQLAADLDQMGVRRYASRGNFVLIDCARPVAALYEAMLRQGVIVRPVGNYQLHTHLRLTVGTDAQNERMLAALRKSLSALRNGWPGRRPLLSFCGLSPVTNHQSLPISCLTTLLSPRRAPAGAIRVPGDKSVSHRAMMLGGIAEGVTEVRGFLESEDCLATMNAMRALGVSIERPGAQEVRVHGVGLRGSESEPVMHWIWAMPVPRCDS